MKNKLFLNTLRSVKKSPGRFIAIMAIIAISCAFYSGVKAACPDMKNSAWKYYDEYSLADIQLKSTLGFNDSDAARLAEEDAFDKVYAGYSADLLVDGDNGQAAVHVMSYSPDYPLNKLMITEGRMPEKSGECVADADSGSKIAFAVGDTVTFAADEGEEISDYLDTDEFTVVGLVKSPLYVSFERGSTTIGNGSLSAFIYIPYEDFSYDTYTDIYLSVKNAHDNDVEPFSEEYDSRVEEGEKIAENLSAELLDIRAESIRADADEELAEPRERLADGEKQLDDGMKKYNDGKKELEDAQKDYNDRLSEFEEGESEWNDSKNELDDKEIKMTALADTCVRLDKFLEDYDGMYLVNLPQPLLNMFKEIQKAYDDNGVEADIEDLMALYVITDPAREPVQKETARASISGVNEQVRAATAAALTEIEAGRAALDESKKTLDEGREGLEKYKSELDDAQKELDDAEEELVDAQTQIDDANKEINDALTELDELIADGEWYIWNRGEMNPGCLSYGKDAERVESIAAVFPLFFIIIAALVCSTTMSRMVEEQRTETGTLKALGYSGASIIMQYVLYAVTASVVGSVIGTIAGFPLLPNIIYICYKTMYRYPYFEAPFMPGFALGCLGVSILCTGLAAVYTSVKELKFVPAALIRPKPPKNGKRIFLEKIGFFWNRLKFTQKVTFRNLFRYMSRFLMAVIGIGGCTALLLTAFGLKEAIACIADKQYEEIFVYDAVAVASDKSDEDDRKEIFDVLDEDDRITGYITAAQETKDVYSQISPDPVECYIFSPDNIEEFGDYIVLRDRKSGSPITLEEGGAVITEKTAKMLGVSAGDSITIADSTAPVRITAVTENYTFHYVYMLRSTFNSVMGEKQSNMILFNTGGTPEKSVRDEIAEKLVSCDSVITASFMYDGADNFRKLVSSLNLIVVVLIIFSGALAFVILFNLANININERVRELATIKVLGFFDKEVGDYINRENVVSSVIGMIFGLGLGIVFERFVVKTAEVDEVMFSPDIPWFCFIFSVAMMIVFTVIVNLFLYFKLKKIDMASSMKAIE